MAIQPVSKLMATVGWDGVDPGFSYQFLEEDGGTAKVEDYVKAGWDAERRQDLHPRLPRDVLRADHADLSAHPRLVRVLGHPGQEPVGGDERRQERQAGARRHRGGLGAGHRPHRPRQAAARTTRRPSATSADKPRPVGSPGRLAAPAHSPSEHADALDQPHPLPVPVPGRALGAGVHGFSARLFALPRLLQDRAEGRGHARQGADARRRRASRCSELQGKPQHQERRPEATR